MNTLIEQKETILLSGVDWKSEHLGDITNYMGILLQTNGVDASMNIAIFFATAIAFYGIYTFGFFYDPSPNNPTHIQQYNGLDNEWINFTVVGTAFVLSGLCLKTYKQKPIKKGVQ